MLGGLYAEQSGVKSNAPTIAEGVLPRSRAPRRNASLDRSAYIAEIRELVFFT